MVLSGSEPASVLVLALGPRRLILTELQPPRCAVRVVRIGQHHHLALVLREDLLDLLFGNGQLVHVIAEPLGEVFLDLVGPAGVDLAGRVLALAQALMAEVNALKEKIPALEADVKKAEEELHARLATIPNLPLDDVPREIALEFVAGSHRWGRDFRPQRFDGSPLYADDSSETSISTASPVFLRWNSAAEMPPAMLRERLDLFAAYHAPGLESAWYDSITPVNVFPIVLNAYFDAALHSSCARTRVQSDPLRAQFSAREARA